jgi:hypothetical protein
MAITDDKGAANRECGRRSSYDGFSPNRRAVGITGITGHEGFDCKRSNLTSFYWFMPTVVRTSNTAASLISCIW